MKINDPNLKTSYLSRLSVLGWVTVATVVTSIAPLSSLPTIAAPAFRLAQQASAILYVDPGSGADNSGVGQSASVPFKTISYALKQAQPGTTIQLAPGTYSTESGEQFPLILPSGVTLKGNIETQGANILIKGGGEVMSPSFARQQVGILAQGNSQILGVTVTNGITRGSGVWVESGTPTIANSTFTGNHRDGVFVTGSSAPKVLSNVFTKNGGNGISLARDAQGEIRDNQFIETGFGLAIGGNSAPLIVNNQIRQNMDGIVISDKARPVIRQNQIDSNTRDGVVVIGTATPDLGQAGTAGNNVIAKNKRYDLNNSNKMMTVVVAGNTLDPKRVSGKVSFESATQTPIVSSPTPTPKTNPSSATKTNPTSGTKTSTSGTKTPTPGTKTTSPPPATKTNSASGTKTSPTSGTKTPASGTRQNPTPTTKTTSTSGTQVSPPPAAKTNPTSGTKTNPTTATKNNPTPTPKASPTAPVAKTSSTPATQASPIPTVAKPNSTPTPKASPTAPVAKTSPAPTTKTSPTPIAKTSPTTLAQASPTPKPSSGQLTDIKGHWAQPFIEALVSRQIISGFPDGSFHPDDPVTRVQYAVIVAKLKPALTLPAQNFEDVPSDSWAYNAISTAYRSKYLSAYAGNLFKPDEVIRRVQVLVSLANGLGLKPTDVNAISFYEDASQIPSEAKAAVAAVTERRLVVNHPTLKQLNPNQNATRAEVAAFIYQSLVLKGTVPAIASPYIVVRGVR